MSELLQVVNASAPALPPTAEITPHVARAMSPPLTPHLEVDAMGHFGVFRDVKLRSAYQPIVSITHRTVVGYEALLRPHFQDGSQADPTQFLAQSAVQGEHLEVDRLSRVAHIANFSPPEENAWLFLNMHPDAFNQGRKAGHFPMDALQRFGVPPRQIVLELLEHHSHDDDAFQAAALHYREQGFMLAIDDFGSGQSNFDRVWKLRPDFVKLDRRLVQRAEESVVNQRMVRGMVALLHQADAMVVAEGVETRRQALVMMEADVDFLQGFWLARPQAVSDQRGAQQAISQLDLAWEGFARYDETLAREWQQSLKPFGKAIRAAGSLFEVNQDRSAAAQLFFSFQGGLRFFLLNAQGVLEHPSIVNPSSSRKTNENLGPLRPVVGSNWSRRSYFKQAIKNLGKVIVVGPHYSLADGKGCYTVALGVPSPGGTVVLCGDFELLHERMIQRPLSEYPADLRAGTGDYDPTLSVIGLASGMPRLRSA